MTEKKMLNGIDVAALRDTMDEIKKKPELAKFMFRAHNEWIEGAHLRVSIKDFYGAGKEDTSRAKAFVLDGDEPRVLLGTDKGPNATESLLAALSSCLNATLVYYASAQGIRLEQSHVDVEGDLDVQGFLGLSHNVEPGFTNIRVNFMIKADAPREKIDELVKLAQKRSPVFNSVTKGVPVSVGWKEAVKKAA